MTSPGTGLEVVEVGLPGGRRLVVRPATDGDTDGVLALYDSLSVQDLHRRFFTVFHPDRRWVRTWLGSAPGVVLVAELLDPGAPSDAAIIGEAGYAQIADGDGELGICVAPTWRGWLGAYLLELLLDTAAARGVATVAADVLAENGPMLALARSHRAEHRPSDDPAVVRVAFATGASGPVPAVAPPRASGAPADGTGNRASPVGAGAAAPER